MLFSMSSLIGRGIPIPTVFITDKQYFGLENWDIYLFVSLARPFTVCFLREWNWSIKISQGYLHEENMRVNIKGPRQGNGRRNRYTRPSCIGPRKQNVWWTKLPGLHVNRGGFMSDIRPTPTVRHTKYSIWKILKVLFYLTLYIIIHDCYSVPLFEKDMFSNELLY